MLREIMVVIAEGLFWVTNGELLLNTLWFWPWILLWALVMASPMFYVTHMKWNGRGPGWPAFAFLLLFFPGLVLATGPGIAQMQMMQECKTVETVVESDQVEPTVMQFQECRVKDNYYGEFGPWQLRK